jgi:3D-(3,5/4)-trihydroxycyclohexane-1,2-dione acylhydrolase (decyclizing)
MAGTPRGVFYNGHRMKISHVKLTMAQALCRWMVAQRTHIDGQELPYFAGVWAIFGHGNVAGMGEALAGMRDTLPTLRAHNEQAMAHAAIAFGKCMRRRRVMACTTSIGPGATNMVTAAALAHVNRLPILLLPGDVFASRRPDPVLQQIEDFTDGTVSANDAFRPVSRYFDRIARPEQLLDSLPRAISVLTDPAGCGPVTLALCQDTQTEAFHYPQSLFSLQDWTLRRIRPDRDELGQLAARISTAQRPLIIAGGGVLYSQAEEALCRLVEKTGMPVAETQAGKSALRWNHPQSLGAIGVTGSSAANRAAADADLVIGIGTRLQDFTSGSRSLVHAPLVQVNVAVFDAFKHGALPVIGDARAVIEELIPLLPSYRVSAEWHTANTAAVADWNAKVDAILAAAPDLPSDAEVIGAVWRATPPDATIVAAAGGLPGELHKFWRSRTAGDYHVEYGFSCMGYEIAGGLGAKLAAPHRELYVLLGDGSYLMMNSELATAAALGIKLTVVLLDNGGFGCINRLQQATGSAPFNNLLDNAATPRASAIDFVGHARSLGAEATKVSSIAQLEAALRAALKNPRSQVFVIDTDPNRVPNLGGHWWDVAVAEVSKEASVQAARREYRDKLNERES